jgi:hypothetical protein
MKELITDVAFVKEYESKFGKLYSFKVSYLGRSAFYSSKSKEQTKFVKGQEAEFTEETKESKNGSYLVIKPPMQNKQSNFGKSLNREKTKYSGFAVSYAKDLVVAGRLDRYELIDYAWVLFNAMSEMDKTLES